MNRDELLREVKARVQAVYGERLRGIVLYGSEANGTAGRDSDLDLLVLLDGPVQLGADSRRIIDALYPLVLSLGRPIHAQPVEAETYEAGEFTLYRRAKQEGVRV